MHPHALGSGLRRLTQQLDTTSLPALLTHGILGRLDLRAWQALASTSRACRQLLASADDVLAVLVQVSAAQHLLH